MGCKALLTGCVDVFLVDVGEEELLVEPDSPDIPGVDTSGIPVGEYFFEVLGTEDLDLLTYEFVYG